MIYELIQSGGLRPHYRVRVDGNEVVVASGKTLPYPTWIGVVHVDTGDVTVWTPAAYVPRGYKARAKEMMAQAQAELRAQGKVGT